MSNKKYDCIVIGGGPSAVHTAFPLVEKGFSVLMLDGGVDSDTEVDVPRDNFEHIRKNYQNQHEVFLGKDLSGAIPPEKGSQSDHMTSGRFSYITKHTNFLPVDTSGFLFNQTLAKGGMTEIWGGASDVFDNDELKAVGLRPAEIHEHYQKIINRIGISGNLKNYNTQKPALLSTHSAEILKRFTRNQNSFKSLNVDFHQSALALLTQDLSGRKATEYNDTDYWDDKSTSLYKARYTIDELKSKENFEYIQQRIVTHVKENQDGVRVYSTDFQSRTHEYESRYIIVSAGALNTVRILLRSFNIYDTKVKITSKPSVITPCIDPRFIGKTEDIERHSLCQLVLENLEKTSGSIRSYSQFYKYKSLLTFKLLKFLPITKPESLSFLSMFLPAMVIVDSRFPSSVNSYKTCELQKRGDTSVLKINYENSTEERESIKTYLRIVKKSLRMLGLVPLKDVFMQEGTSSHYAGGVSTEEGTDSPLRADSNGKVVGTSRIFVADASLWKALSAKPPTLTIMANANRIGEKLAQILKQ